MRKTIALIGLGAMAMGAAACEIQEAPTLKNAEEMKTQICKEYLGEHLSMDEILGRYKKQLPAAFEEEIKAVFREEIRKNIEKEKDKALEALNQELQEAVKIAKSLSQNYKKRTEVETGRALKDLAARLDAINNEVVPTYRPKVEKSLEQATQRAIEDLKRHAAKPAPEGVQQKQTSKCNPQIQQIPKEKRNMLSADPQYSLFRKEMVYGESGKWSKDTKNNDSRLPYAAQSAYKEARFNALSLIKERAQKICADVAIVYEAVDNSNNKKPAQPTDKVYTKIIFEVQYYKLKK